MERKLFKKKDFFVIAVLLIFAGVFYYFTLPGDAGNTAEISVDGNIVDVVSLSGENDGVYKIEGMNISYEINDGEIAIISSDCPDKVCIDDGFISLGGQKIVCLPNKTVISIPRDSDDDIDIMLH